MFDEHTEIPGEQILLDENVEAEGHDYSHWALPASAPTAMCSRTSSTWSVMSVIRCGSGIFGPEAIPGRDCRHRRRGDAGHRQPNRLLHHRRRGLASRNSLAAPTRLRSARRKVYHEADERLACGRPTRSDAYVLIASGRPLPGGPLRRRRRPDAEFVTVLPRRDGVEYSVGHAIVDGQDRFLILHNDAAENFTSWRRLSTTWYAADADCACDDV